MDAVLDGGFRRGQFYLLVGAPGTGKTVLATELAFRHAASDHRVVVVSFLSEPHGSLVTNVAPFSFFDPKLLAEHKVTLLSASRPMLDGGLPALVEFIRAAVTQTRASLLIIEGLRAIEMVSDSALSTKRFLGDLASLGPMLGCTIVCTVVGEPDSRATHEQVMADGVFELGREESGIRRPRTFEVLKLRGGRHLEGVHTVTIDEAGFQVWPRLESLWRNLAEEPAPELERLGFGIARFDEMLEGGLVSGSSTGLLGAPGSGKTLFGLHFLAEGCARREPSLFFGFYESPQRLLAKARGVGLTLDRFAKARGPLELIWQPALEEPVDVLADRLLSAVRRRGVRRLFVDGIDGFEISAEHPTRIRRFFAALAAELRALGVATVFSEETPLFSAPIHKPQFALSTVYDNIILLRYLELRGDLHRMVSILKMRESDYESSVREFSLSKSGIELAPTKESAAMVLSGREHSVHAHFAVMEPEQTAQYAVLPKRGGRK